MMALLVMLLYAHDCNSKIAMISTLLFIILLLQPNKKSSCYSTAFFNTIMTLCFHVATLFSKLTYNINDKNAAINVIQK